MKWPGQVDLKGVLTTIVGAAIIGAFTIMWNKAEAGEEALRSTKTLEKTMEKFEKRFSRMEDTLERFEDRLPAKSKR